MKTRPCYFSSVLIMSLTLLLLGLYDIKASTDYIHSDKTDDNIILNGDFSTPDLTDWHIYLFDPINMGVDMTIIDNECYLTNISNAGTTENWHIQILQTFTANQKDNMVPGKVYELSFDARALSGSKEVYVFLGQNEGTWMPYVNETVTISEDMQNYSFLFTLEEVFSMVRLLFGISENETSMVLDNIRFEEKKIKVLNWNICLGGYHDLDTVFTVITNSDADIALIQEVSTIDDFFEMRAEEEGYYCVQNRLHTQGFPYQPAVLSKFPILSFEIYQWMASIEIEIVPGIRVKVYSIHLSGTGFWEHYYKMMHIVQQYLRYDREKYPTIFGGDFNEYPFNTEVTGQLSAIGFTQDVRDTLEYTYSYAMESIPGSQQVIGNIEIGDPYDGKWPSDHNAVYVEYYVPNVFPQETQTFTLKNNFGDMLELSAQEFTDHFPKGGLTAVKFLKLGQKGTLMLNSADVTQNQVLTISELDNLIYEDNLIGYDEIEWIGLSGSEEANTSSFLYIENTAVIDSFDRKKSMYDVDLISPGTALYFGNFDVFVSTSVSELNGAEFVKFATFAMHFWQEDQWNDYFLMHLNTSSDVYLAFDDRHITPPWWIEGYFTLLSNENFISDDHSYTLYKKHADPGNFTFGSMYFDWDWRDSSDQFIFIVVPDEPETISHRLIDDPQSEEILLYPNPKNGVFTLDLGKEYSDIKITIALTDGKEISCMNYKKGKTLQIGFTAPPGIYLLGITTENWNKTLVIRNQ